MSDGIKAEIREGRLFIEIPVWEPVPSVSGKSLVVASTHGNVTTTLTVNGKPVHIGVNAFIKR